MDADTVTTQPGAAQAATSGTVDQQASQGALVATDLLFSDGQVFALSVLLAALLIVIYGWRYFGEQTYRIPLPSFSGVAQSPYAAAYWAKIDESQHPGLFIPHDRYTNWRLAFIAVVGFVYAVILAAVLKGAPGLEEVARAHPLYASFPAMAAAFLVTGVWSGVPWVERYLRQIREFFHRRAEIPLWAEKTMSALRQQRIAYDSTALALVHHFNPSARDHCDARHLAMPIRSPDYGLALSSYLLGAMAQGTHLGGGLQGAAPLPRAVIEGQVAINELYDRITHQIESGEKTASDLEADITVLKDHTIYVFILWLSAAVGSDSMINDFLARFRIPARFARRFEYGPMTLFLLGAGLVAGWAVMALIIDSVARALIDQPVDGKPIDIQTVMTVAPLLLLTPAITVLWFRRIMEGRWPARFPRTHFHGRWIAVSTILGTFAGFVGYVACEVFDQLHDKPELIAFSVVTAVITAWRTDWVIQTRRLPAIIGWSAAYGVLASLVFALMFLVIVKDVNPFTRAALATIQDPYFWLTATVGFLLVWGISVLVGAAVVIPGRKGVQGVFLEQHVLPLVIACGKHWEVRDDEALTDLLNRIAPHLGPNGEPYLEHLLRTRKDTTLEMLRELHPAHQDHEGAARDADATAAGEPDVATPSDAAAPRPA